MRLISLTVRNYRIHRDRSVEFDPERTVIGGPNETGKSTLMEAAHRALFLPYRRGGQDLEGMRSRHGSEPPEVELVFEARGRRFTLVKRFKGGGGHAELRDETHERWSGQDAEEKLAQLLGYREPVAARQADAQWAHLWIRQGASASDPTAEATRERDALLARLQSQGGAAVMQSDRDSRVAAGFVEARDKLFTQNGGARAGSALKDAEDALAAARARLEEKQQAARRLGEAIQTFESATRRGAEADAEIPKLQELTAATEQKSQEAERLEHEATQAGKDLAEAKTRCDALAKTDADIRELAARIDTETRRTEPLRRRLDEAAAAKERAEKQLDELRRKSRQATTEVAELRRRVEWLRAVGEKHRIDDELAKLDERRREIEALQKALAEPEKTLAGLPAVEASDIVKLRDLDAARREAAAALEAMATGIEWLDGPGPVAFDGDALQPGEPRIVTDAGELSVAGHTLRIRPGGGNRLDQAREALDAARRDFESAVETLGVAGLDEAVRCFEKRRATAAELEQRKAKLEDLDPRAVSAEIEARNQDRLRIHAQLERHDPGDRAEPEDSREALSRAADQLGEAERRETTARALLERHETECASARERWELVRQQLDEQRQDLRDMTNRHEVLVETHGDPDRRRAALADAQRRREALAEKAESIRKKLAELQPELLAADLERHRRALEKQREARQRAETERAAAGAVLESDGGSDPHGALREAIEALDRAERAHAVEHRRGQAVKRLAELFCEEQQRLSDQFTEPLVEKVGDYLRCVFGPDARAKMTLDAGRFQGLELVRPGGLFTFDDLSGGTREQVAAAVRLAMAELLAADHDGCLPMVFDDAFTHSDPDRVLALQRMLDLAAARGLQVIILTCTPSDYASLGAAPVLLDEPPRSPATPDPFADVESSAATPESGPL
jgi:recombinational DNA repair ATPase RecF